MTHDEVCESDHYYHGSVNIAESRLVTLGWREFMDGYNTADTIAEIGPRK